MRKLFALLCGVLVCFVAACSDEEQELQPKETPQVVKDVVEALEETVPQASDFVEILKQVDLTDVAAEKLTVFAVRNEVATRANMELDTISVKRHIVIGSYKKEELTDGQELTCVNGDKLLVTKVGDEVSVNGVVITGEAIPVGDSYIYVVPKVIPERENALTLYETTFKVWELLAYDYMWDREPLPEVSVKVFNSSRESLGTYVTDASGEVVVSHASDTIFYQLEKEGFRMYIDYNGDGQVSSDEMKEGESILVYEGSSNKMTLECCMKATLEQPQPMSVYEAQEQWKSQIRAFYVQNRALNQELVYGDNGFSYTSVESVSNAYWKDAYSTVERGLELQTMAAAATTDTGLWEQLSQQIQVDLGVVYCDLLGYYDQFVFRGMSDSEPTSDVNALSDYLEVLSASLPTDYKGAAQALIARLALSQSNFQKAYQVCKEIIASGNYRLLAGSEDVFATADNDAVIWAGYNDTVPELRKGTYFHPIRYVEVLLMAAEAAYELGQTADAMNYLNEIAAAKGESLNVSGALDKGHIRDSFIRELANEGLEYSIWRRLGISDEQLNGIGGYQSHNSLLPIPIDALQYYSFLKQNPGY